MPLLSRPSRGLRGAEHSTKSWCEKRIGPARGLRAGADESLSFRCVESDTRADSAAPLSDDLSSALASLAPLGIAAPDIGLVLGSGLGGFVDVLGEPTVVPYDEIAGMPRPGVHGHAGALHLGRVAGARVAALAGRVHLYEGRSTNEVTFGVRLLARLGCRCVIVTNASGGIDEAMQPGEFLLIADHMNLTGRNPLCGAGALEGPRFVDMTVAYDESLRELARRAARSAGLTLHEGVYAGVLGPSYETPAEIRMLRALGAACVGMSTVLEVIALRQLGVPVAGLSCITNMAAGVSKEALSHEEVARTGAQAAAAMQDLVTRWIEAIEG